MATRKQLSHDEWLEGGTGRLEETLEDKRKHRETRGGTDGDRWQGYWEPLRLTCSVELVEAERQVLLVFLFPVSLEHSGSYVIPYLVSFYQSGRGTGLVFPPGRRTRWLMIMRKPHFSFARRSSVKAFKSFVRAAG